MNRLISLLVYILYRLIFLTVRVQEIQRPQVMMESLRKRFPLVYAHWHGDEWLLLGIWRRRPMAVLSSLSHQGERMSFFMKLLGFQVFRGSSSRGGVMGLKALIETMGSKNVSTSLAVDGPRGPLHECKPGVIQLARLTGSPIIPVVATCSSAWVLKKSWSQAKIPKPMSTISVVYGAPIHVAEDKEKLEDARMHLNQQMNSLSAILSH